MTDEIDHKLLALLRGNAREPAAALAKKLKISRGTVQNRIARMLATRAIRF
jgi:DNA-binding Lrp family transcriptional regulator